MQDPKHTEHLDIEVKDSGFLDAPFTEWNDNEVIPTDAEGEE
jgi:hypothetical protein